MYCQVLRCYAVSGTENQQQFLKLDMVLYWQPLQRFQDGCDIQTEGFNKSYFLDSVFQVRLEPIQCCSTYRKMIGHPFYQNRWLMVSKAADKSKSTRKVSFFWSIAHEAKQIPCCEQPYMQNPVAHSSNVPSRVQLYEQQLLSR